RRLLDQLDAALQHGLTVVSAPAGSGKTSLVVDWTARIGARAVVAWLSLDRRDDDPARFWRHELAALHAERAGLVTHHQRVLRGAPRLLVEALGADIDALQDDVVFVLDDYHLIQSSQIHAGLIALLDHAPPCFHVILSSRVDPPLALARRRLEGDVLEVRAADL